MQYRPKGVGNEEDVLLSSSKAKPKFRPTLWWFWLILLALICFATVVVIYLLITSQSEMIVTKLLDDDSELRALTDEFARTVTRQDWKANAELFVTGSTIDFHRAFTFLTDYPPLSLNNDLLIFPSGGEGPVGSWGQQLSVFAGGLSSNHLMIGNCNMSYGTNTANMDCIALYTYTLAYSTSLFTNNFPTQMVVFQPRFDAVKTTSVGWRFTNAIALVNATSTLLSSVETGVAPPGAITTKRGFYQTRGSHKRDASTTWSTLQDQINSLVLKNQIDTAKAICRTDQYINLAATFDPYQNDTAFMCNTIMRIPVTLDSPMTCGLNGSINASCLNGDLDAIKTINSIEPLMITRDYTITGGFGIAIQAGLHGLTIHNVGLTAIPLIGTPELDFNITTYPIPMLTVIKLPQNANTVWAGPVSGPPAESGFRLLVLDDIPLIDLSTHVTNVLGLSNGGTNNAGPYAGGRIIVSNVGGTQLEEAPALAEGFFLVSDGMGGFVPGSVVPGDGINITYSGGIFTVIDLESQAVHQVDLSVPTDIFQVTSLPITDNGTITFVVIPQAAKTFWAGPTSGSPADPFFRAIVLTDLPLIDLSTHVTNILAVANGGTNNDGSSWVGERVMMSDTGGTSITEGTITGENGVSITFGPGPSMIISGAGGTCDGNTTIDQSCLDISTLTCPGGALANNCIPGALVLNSLGVTGATSLGTSTICTNPLNANCLDISTQSCPGGPLNANCVPPNLDLTTLTVQNLIAYDFTLVNGTISSVEQGEFEILNVTLANADYINLIGTMTCTPPGMIDSSCYDISGKICTSPIDTSCFPSSYTFNNVSVVDTITVNQMVCAGNPIPDECTPRRIKTINGILPTVSPGLNFLISAGTGISISPITNGITVSNTGVTSVGLSLPSSILSVMVSPVTTTGTLTAVLQTQVANTFWAGPLMGSPATPAFRAIEFLDLPTAASTNSVYFVNGGGTLGVFSLSLSLAVPTSEFSISGSPIVNPTGGFTITKQTQVAKSFWAGPLSGSPAQPTFRSLSLGDFSPLGLTNGQVLTGVTAGDPVGKTLVAGSNMMITEMAGSFVFEANSVDAIQNISMTVPSWLSVTPTTLTSSGTFDITANTQAANKFLAGPTSGGAAVPDFRSIGYSDLPPLADGQLYIGSTGMAPVPSQLTAGTLITITPGPGTSTVSTTALGMVTLNLPTDVFDVFTSYGPNTETINVSFDNQTANTFFAGPTSGGSDVPTFRPLVTADLPVAILLSYQEAASTTAIMSFSSATYTVVTTMVLTPAAGTYWCSFSGSIIPSTSSGFYDIALHLNGVIIAHSARHANGASAYFNMHTLAVITTPGGQDIDVRWRKSSGSGSADMYERSLYCLRIG